MKAKYLKDIQEHVNRREFSIAQKKLIRYQSQFRFKENDPELVRFYSILFQLGSYKLFQKLILAQLDFNILSREDLDQDTILKLTIWAYVLACQGAHDTCQLILSKIKDPDQKITSPYALRLFYKSLHLTHLYNNEIEESVIALDRYVQFAGEDKTALIFYFGQKVALNTILKEFESAKTNLEIVSTLALEEGSLYRLDYVRLLQFILKTAQGVVDSEGYALTESMCQYLVSERLKLSIISFQFKYLDLIHNQAEVLNKIEEIDRLAICEGGSSLFLEKCITELINSGRHEKINKINFRLNLKSSGKSLPAAQCLEWIGGDLFPREYFAIPVYDRQIDLLAGMIIDPKGGHLLTELQQKCLFSIIASGECGINWPRLSESMYGADLNLEKNFENVRKMMATLRKMNLNILYENNRYFFVNDFQSIILKNEFTLGDQILYIQRVLGQQEFTAEQISQLLGLKKSRISDYLREWVGKSQVVVVPSKGNQKKYQIKNFRPEI